MPLVRSHRKAFLDAENWTRARSADPHHVLPSGPRAGARTNAAMSAGAKRIALPTRTWATWFWAHSLYS